MKFFKNLKVFDYSVIFCIILMFISFSQKYYLDVVVLSIITLVAILLMEFIEKD